MQELQNLFCSISFVGERILRLSESKEKVFSLPNVSKMPKGNGTQRKAADGPARLKINCVPLKALKCHTIVWNRLSLQGTNAFYVSLR